MSDDAAPVATPSQTVGPFLHLALGGAHTRGSLVHGFPVGERIRLGIRVIDGDGQPVTDALVELSYQGVFGRMPTGDDGACEFETVRPGTVPNAPGGHHISVCLFARGLLRQLHTRIYFAADEAPADAVLALVPEPRRGTLFAAADANDPHLWRFDIRLQGNDETVFFDM